MVMGPIKKNLLFNGAVGHDSLEFLQRGMLRREGISCDAVRALETIGMFSVDAATPLVSTARQRWTVELRLHRSIYDAWISAAHHNGQDGKKQGRMGFFFFVFFFLESRAREPRAKQWGFHGRV